MSFPRENFRKDYVPFVGRTAAPNICQKRDGFGVFSRGQWGRHGRRTHWVVARLHRRKALDCRDRGHALFLPHDGRKINDLGASECRKLVQLLYKMTPIHVRHGEVDEHQVGPKCRGNVEDRGLDKFPIILAWDRRGHIVPERQDAVKSHVERFAN